VTTAEQLHDRGYATGQSSLLTNMLAVKFGALDNDTHDRVAHATQEQITLWSSRLVQGAETLDDVFRS